MKRRTAPEGTAQPGTRNLPGTEDGAAAPLLREPRRRGDGSLAVDHFVPVPLRFFEALTAGELAPAQVMVGILIAHRCYEVRNTAGGVATVRLATLADLCGVTDDTIQRKLDVLRDGGWIDFERPKPGQRMGWRIWLKGLERNVEADPTSALAPQHLRTSSTEDPPPVRRSSSAALPAPSAATPHGERDRGSAQAPHVNAADPTDETRRDETKKTVSEEKLDHVLGETTGSGTATRNREPVHVEREADDSLVWSGEPQEGEEGLLADCQALVNASFAEWR
jgi:hypothetical protein